MSIALSCLIILAQRDEIDKMYFKQGKNYMMENASILKITKMTKKHSKLDNY